MRRFCLSEVDAKHNANSKTPSINSTWLYVTIETHSVHAVLLSFVRPHHHFWLSEITEVVWRGFSGVV